MSPARRLFRRMGLFRTGTFTSNQLLLFVVLSAPSTYFWTWVLHAPKALIDALWWPALAVSVSDFALRVGVAFLMRTLIPRSGPQVDNGPLWVTLMGIAAAASSLIGIIGQRPDLGYGGAFLFSSIAVVPRAMASRDLPALAFQFAKAAWLALVFMGFGWLALILHIIEAGASFFVRRGPLWVIRRRPLFEDALAEAREALAASKDYDRIKPLNDLRQMEQWQDLLEAKQLPDPNARRWFNAKENAQIQLGLRRPRRALAALRSEESELEDLVQFEVEAYLQVDDVRSAEAALRRPRRRRRMDLFRSPGDIEEYFAWGQLYRHRGDDLRALYFFEQPFAGAVVDRNQWLAAVKLLLKLDLPLEAAKSLEQMLELVPWIKTQDIELLADCYRRAGHVGLANRVQCALAEKLAGAGNTSTL